MGQYNKAILTVAGENLIARTLAGEIQLNITKAKTSNYIYPAGIDFKLLTDMQGIKQIATDPATAVYNDTMIQTRVLFSNEEVAFTYYIQNIGLYAMDGTQEVLFCIVTAEMPDEMPQYNGVASTSYIYNIQNTVQDTAELNITVIPSGTATIQDVLERVDATGGDISETIIKTLDTVEDKYPVPTAGENVKRFFGKMLTLMKNVRPLTGNTTLYVSTIGSDILGDGSELNPFRTIQYAIDTLPKDLNSYTAYVQIADGTYEETVTITGFKSGSVILRTIRGDVISPLTKVTNIICSHNCAYINIGGLDITTTSSDGILCVDCSNVQIGNVRCVGVTDTFKGVYGAEVNLFRVWNCEISNRKFAVFFGNSKGYVNGCTGVSNNTGIYAGSGTIINISGSSIGATFPLDHGYGGMLVYANGTQISDLISSRLSCTWGIINGGYYRNGNISGVAMVVVQLRINLTTNLTAGSTYTISGFPSMGMGGVANVISVAINRPQLTDHCYMTPSGVITFIPVVNIPSTQGGLIFNCSYITNS